MKMEKEGEKDEGHRGRSVTLNYSSLEELESVLDSLVERYQIDYKTLARIVLEKEQDILIPAAIFRDRTKTIIELAFSYLKHNYNLAPAEISKILNIPSREAKKLWDASAPVDSIKESPFVPAQIIGGVLSPFENIVEYLKERKRMKNSEIAHVLARSNKTIWTVYERAKEKKFAGRAGK